MEKTELDLENAGEDDPATVDGEKVATLESVEFSDIALLFGGSPSSENGGRHESKESADNKESG